MFLKSRFHQKGKQDFNIANYERLDAAVPSSIKILSLKHQNDQNLTIK